MAWVYLDGFFLKVHREGLGVEKEAVYVALGVTPCGKRQILGFWLLPTENATASEGPQAPGDAGTHGRGF